MPVEEVLRFYGKKNTFFARFNYYFKYVGRFFLEKLAFFCVIKKSRTAIHRLRGVNIGAGVYIGHEVIFDRVFPDQIFIGDNTSIGDRCIITSHANIPSDTILKKIYPRTIKQTKIGKNIWIMPQVVITPGVTIGDYSVIATGAIVTKDIPPMVLAAGVPAKPVKDLFNELKIHISKDDQKDLIRKRNEMGYEVTK
jgi:acetyltransferase-like isoleucine patch superfamily enzyme